MEIFYIMMVVAFIQLYEYVKTHKIAFLKRIDFTVKEAIFQYVFVYLVSCVWLFCNSMDRSLPGFSIHGIFQAGILEWIAISFSRGSSRPRDWTCISCIGRQILYHWATSEAHICDCVCENIYKYILFQFTYTLYHLHCFLTFFGSQTQNSFYDPKH